MKVCPEPHVPPPLVLIPWTVAEIMSICLTMVSAGLDTVPGNLIMSMAYLSSPHGQEIQARARTEIARVYPNGDAWSRCLSEEKVEYVTAFVKETLRYWTVIPICLPRVNIREIEWQGARIPAGTTFLMVRYLRLRAASPIHSGASFCRC